MRIIGILLWLILVNTNLVLGSCGGKVAECDVSRGGGTILLWFLLQAPVLVSLNDGLKVEDELFPNCFYSWCL